VDNPIKCLVAVKSKRENINESRKPYADVVYTRRSVVQEFIGTHEIIIRRMREEKRPRKEEKK